MPLSVVKSHSAQILGPREDQQDVALRDEVAGAFAVADGMGGHARGRRAAEVAVGAFHASVRFQREMRELYRGPGEVELERHPLSVTNAMLVADKAVQRLARPEDKKRKPGCTLVGLIVDPSSSTVRFATVGDSRIYLARGDGGQFRQWGTDQAEGNLLTAALGLDLQPNEVQGGSVDRLGVGRGMHLALLVTDGVHGRVGSQSLEALVKAHAESVEDDPKTLPRRIVTAVIGAVRKRGPTDNATTLCVAWKWS